MVDTMQHLQLSLLSIIQDESYTLGIIALLIGLVSTLITLLVLRKAPHKIEDSKSLPPPPDVFEGSQTDAVLLVQSGGRVVFINQTAREWFGIRNGNQSLEILARKTDPQETFLGLCTAGGKAHFTVKGRFVEGVSFSMPYGLGSAVLVALRRPRVASHDSGDLPSESSGGQAIATIAEISQLVSANLDLESTLRAIFESVDRLIFSDFSQISIWEPENHLLRTYRLIGQAGNDRQIEKTGEWSTLDEGVSGQIINQRSPLLINDVKSATDIPPLQDKNQIPYSSYLGLPLMVADRILGTMELGAYLKEAFTQNDLEVLRILTGQAAVALNNALIYQMQQQRLKELTSLAEMTQTVDVLVDSRDLYSRLGESIKHLVPVEVIGFWIYDETRHTLEAQLPFIGIPPYYTDLFHLPVPSGSKAESILFSQETIFAPDAENDQRLEALGLTHRAKTAGIHSTVLIPLKSKGHALGYLQVGNKLDNTPFNEDDIRLLSIIRGQAAILIENAHLVQEAQSRALRAESLRKITSLAGSAATLDEILKFSLLETARLTHSDTGLLLLHDPTSGEPFIHRDSLFGVSPEMADQLSRITFLPNTLSKSDDVEAKPQSYSSGDVRLDINLPQDLRSISVALTMVSIIVIPLVVNDHVVGKMILGSRSDNHFDQHDRILLETIAGQLAASIERTNSKIPFSPPLERLDQAQSSTSPGKPPTLSSQSRTQVNERITQRAFNVLKLWEVVEILNQQTDRDSLLYILGKEILNRLEMTAVLVGVVDDRGVHTQHILGSIPPSTNPEAYLGQRNPLRQCLQPSGFASSEGTNADPNIFVPDLNDCPEWNTSPLLQALKVRGFICLSIPIDDGNTPQSVLSKMENPFGVEAAILGLTTNPLPSFSQEDRKLYTRFTQQVAKALKNIRLVSEVNRRLEEVNLLFEFGLQLSTLDPSRILSSLVETSRNVLVKAQATLIALWDPRQNCLVPQAASGYRDNHLIVEIKYPATNTLPARVITEGNPLCIGEVDFARSYPLSPEDLLRYRNATGGQLPVSTLLVPIPAIQPESYDNSTTQPTPPLGVLILENFQIPYAFDLDDQKVIVSLVQQAALALENAHLYQASEHRARQLHALNDIAATITSTLQTDELIASLLELVKTLLPFDTGSLWLRKQDQLTIRAANGFEDNEERIGLSVAIEDSFLYREMISTGKVICVEDVSKDARFSSMQEHKYHSWLAVPLIAGGEVIGVIVLEKMEPGFFTADHLQMITTFAGQSAVALVNANLYEESIRRTGELEERSKRLGLLNRLSAVLGSSLDSGHILQMTVQEILLAVNCTAASAVLFDPSGQNLLQAETPRIEEKIPANLPNAPLFDGLRESLGIFVAEDIYTEDHLLIYPDLDPLQEFLSSRNTRGLSIIPLITGSDIHGLILLHNNQPYRLSADEFELVRTICNQAAVAIQNSTLFSEIQWLFAETRQNSAELALLYDLGVHISQVLDQQELVRLVLDYVTQLLQVGKVTLLIRHDNGDLISQTTENGIMVRPVAIPATGKSLVEHVLVQEEPLLIGDVIRDVKNFPDLQSDGLARSWVGVPLLVRGSTIGVLAAQSNEPDKFNETHLRLLRQIGNQMAVALENARLFTTVQNYAVELEKRVTERTTQLAREHKRTQTLLGIISELSTSLDMEIVLHRTLALVNEITGAQHSDIVLAHPEDQDLSQPVSIGGEAASNGASSQTTTELNKNIANWVVSKRDSLLIPDLADDSCWIPGTATELPYRSLIAVPLEIGEEILGTLLLFHEETNQFSPDQLDLAQATAKQIAVAINNAQLYSLIRDQAERLGDMLRWQHIETSQSQAILEAVADGVLVTDSKRVITLFNESAEKILGLNRAAVLGRTLGEFIGLFGNAAQTWMNKIQSWSEDATSMTEKVSRLSHTEQIELEDKRVVSVHLSPVFLRSDFLGTVSIFRDITHQVEIDRLKSEFVATVSHELRTPMTSIKGYAEVLLMGAAGQLNDQQTHFLEIVKTNTERLAILVNDLLDISRIEAGRVSLSTQPMDMSHLVDEAVADIILRCEKEHKPMTIRKEASPDTPRAFGDPERVRQIIDNLLENAFSYTPEGGEIVLRLSSKNGEVQIDVQDNGIGIAPSEQARIFERFYRGENPLVLATSGTGLGLSIVQRLVDMHNGRIWLASTGIAGEGSTFSFTLPVYSPAIDRA